MTSVSCDEVAKDADKLTRTVADENLIYADKLTRTVADEKLIYFLGDAFFL